MRASGVGVSTAASRAAAAFGTFLLPTIRNSAGTPAVLIIMGAVSLIGGLTSYFWAPETNGQPLTATSQRTDPHQYHRRRPSMDAPA